MKYARTGAPQTSIDAIPDEEVIAAQSLRVLKAYANGDMMTDHEAYHRVGMNVEMNGARQRCSGLRNDYGFIEWIKDDNGDYSRGITPSGNTGHLSRITTAGLEYLAAARAAASIGAPQPPLPPKLSKKRPPTVERKPIVASHSTILGGSNAQRLLACPASYQELMRSPDTDVSSIYADEGSMLHDMKAADVAGLPRPPIELTTEQVETLDKAGAMLKKLTKAWGGGFRVAAVEETIPFPGVLGSFGTVDLVLHSKTHVLVVDWKFGSGVPVSALYELPDGSDMVNPQLAFYAICARAQRPKLFKGKKIVLAIIQPRLDSLSEVVTDHEELDGFKDSLTAAYSEAIGRDPHRERGEHCRFARCKSTCKLWTGPLLTLEALDPNKAALRGSQSNATEAGYATFLSTAMGIVELAETWAEEIRRQAHAYLSDGGMVEGWKLVPKRGTRQWRDPALVANDLIELGAEEADIFTQPELKSVAQAEKALKPKKITIPDDLWSMISTGTTIAHDDDARPTATHATAVADLRAALKTL